MSAPVPVRHLYLARLLTCCVRSQPRPYGGGGRVLLAALGILAALQDCQALPSVAARVPRASGIAAVAPPGTSDKVLAIVPPCLDGAVAILTDGLRVQYEGAAPNDPKVCVLSWHGKLHHYLAGFWGGGRFQTGTPEERSAITGALTGPIGTKTTFEDTRTDLWGTVTVEHVANPVLALPDGRRHAVKLRIVRHDARGRPNVQRETLHWIDMRTGVALKRQTVTKLFDGEQRLFTTWQVERLAGAAL